MAQKVEGERKFDIAKESVTDFADLLSSDANVMLNVFGHKGNNKNSGKEVSCGTTETVYDLTVLFQFIRKRFKRNQAYRWASIAKSLYDVKDDLADKDGKNYVYIVTDGEETCGGILFRQQKICANPTLKRSSTLLGWM